MLSDEDEEFESQEKLLDIIDALFPSEAHWGAALSYNDFVKDNVAPLISRLPAMASVSDITQAVEQELERRFGSTVSVPFEEGPWEMLLEKMGEEAELFLDEEEDEEEDEQEIILSDSPSDSEFEERP